MRYNNRLQQETAILKEIQASLSMLTTVIDTHSPKTNTRDLIVYASSPITGGKRMYDNLQQYGLSSPSELKTKRSLIYKEKVFQLNLRDGLNFGNELRKRYPQVIVPGEFFAPGWEHEHFMSLWKQVIERHADVIIFNTNWQFSKGCVQEFLIGLQQGLTLLERGKRQPMDKKTGLAKIRQAVEYVDAIGVNVKPLYDIYREIMLFTPRQTKLQSTQII